MQARLWAELGEIRANSKAAAEGMGEFSGQMKSLDRRVRVIENLKHKVMGIVAIATLIGGAVWAWVMDHMLPKGH